MMGMFKQRLLAPALLGMLALAAAPLAQADIMFSGSGDSGFLDGSAEPWAFNADGGAAATGYLNNWGSPGVAAGLATYSQANAAFGMVITFNDGGSINAASVATGNVAGCAGSTGGGSTFCTLDPTDIWDAFITGPHTVKFLAQDPGFFLSQGQSYFVNLFFDGATPTSFNGSWLTSFAPNPVPEPGAVTMFGLGLLGLGTLVAMRRRRSIPA